MSAGCGFGDFTRELDQVRERLGFQGVTGLAFVQLDDTGAASQPLSTSKAHPARIPMRPGLMSRLTEQGGNLLNQLEEASKRMNALLAPENQQTLTTAVANLGQAAINPHTYWTPAT